MALTAPEWLTRHGCGLRPNPDGTSWSILFGDEPQYLLIPVPAAGKHTCNVIQSINGKRLDSGAVYGSAEEALRGGQEDLRKALGW
ncbi:MAG TPA: hypothetical protein VG013_11395 [Gemmataceae bacterium]|jgi:hypothetical protein|nr:hypothetical protein [Gemmataceae bacterium]